MRQDHLLNHIAGFTRPDTGTIEIDGRTITGPVPTGV